MTDNNKKQNEPRKIIHLGSFDFAGSFLKAADRCLNSCKVEAGVEMQTVPGTVCASFSCELFLKYILLAENGEADAGHKLLDLFQKCSAEVQTSLSSRKPDILDILERNNSHFVDARYHHENNGFSFRQQELLQTAEILSKFVRERYLDKDT